MNSIKHILILVLLVSGSSIFAAELEEIVVTAQKRSENVQDVPATVNALTASVMEDFQIRDFNEIGSLIAGTTFNEYDTRRKAVSIRGLFTDPDWSGVALAQNYVNEVPVRPGEAFFELYDIERIEVLKGAQGTLQGVTSPGGAIHIYTKSAEIADAMSGYVESSIADNNGTLIKTGVNIPLTSSLAMRFAGVVNEHDGHEIFNVTTGERENKKIDSQRLSFTFAPIDALDMQLVYEKANISHTQPRPVAGSAGSAPAAVAQTKAFLSQFSPAAAGIKVPSYNRQYYGGPIGTVSMEDGIAIHNGLTMDENDLERTTLTINYSLAGHTLTLIGSDKENLSDTIIDRDFGKFIPGGYYQRVTTASETKHGEIRIANDPGGKIEYVVGAYTNNTDTFTLATVDTTGFQANILGASYPHLFFQVDTIIPLARQTNAFFANVKFNITDSTAIQVGVRDQEMDFFKKQTTDLTTLYTNMGMAYLCGLGMCTLDAIADADAYGSNESTTESFKIMHNLNEDVMVYVSLDSGFRPGGLTITPTALDPSLLVYQDEESDLMEIGVKSILMDGKLMLNASYFETEFDGYQGKADNITVFDRATQSMVNMQGGLAFNADATAEGFEMEWAYVVSDSLTLGGSLASVTVEYDSGTTGPINDPTYVGLLTATGSIAGTNASSAPEDTVNFWADYSAGNYFARLIWSMAGERTDRLVPGGEIGELNTVNLLTGYTSDNGMFEATIWVKNLLDERELAFLSNPYSGGFSFGTPFTFQTNFTEVMTNAPRTMGITLRYNF